MPKVRYIAHDLRFKFPAGTSRGVLQQKKSWFILVEADAKSGIGEAGPLPGLSPDDVPDFEHHLKRICLALEEAAMPTNESEALHLAEVLCGEQLPSIRFALETALLDWLNGGRRLIFDNAFVQGQMAIPINGLIWMGDKEVMRQRMKEKLADGYGCLKMKIGAIGFEDECRILEEVRQNFSPEELVLRVDANGAFSPDEAPDKLARLFRYAIHSIEQPIKAGQIAAMEAVCRQSPVPVALDEELIGQPAPARKALLEAIKPAYIILKPGLLGGFAACRHWISLAEALNIGWWITSALESNIGLNAISQFTASYQPEMPQGLGTGQLYHNNIPSPLRIEGGMLGYNAGATWNLDVLKQ
jgi:O-succinylbenzoate synthase